MAYAASVKAVLFEAADDFAGLVGTLDPRRLAERASGAWTVAELLAHATRAFTATECVLATPVDPASARLASAAAYYRAALSVPGVHEGIVARAREGAELLGDDPAASVRAAIDQLRPLVESTALTTEVQHRAGRLDFGDYLVTRVAELVLHGADLQAALGLVVAASPRPARMVRDLAVELVDRADDLVVACALTGRSWALGCNVLG